MDLLDPGSRRRRHEDANVGEVRHGRRIGPKERDGLQALGARLLERGQHARRSAARRNPERDVARATEGFDLPGEHASVVRIVRDARENARIRGERECRERTPLDAETIHELGGNML